MRGVIHIFLLLLLVILFNKCGACAWNNCLCLQSKIICDETNVAAPRFTAYERKYISGLIINNKQAATILEECRDMPRLDYIQIKPNEDVDHDVIWEEGPSCPKPRCPGVKVICR